MMNIPKEYMLENPANYDAVDFENYLSSTTNIIGLENICTNGAVLLVSYFRTIEHYEVFIDLLKYTMDVNDFYDDNSIIKYTIKLMYQSGFFG